MKKWPLVKKKKIDMNFFRNISFRF